MFLLTRRREKRLVQKYVEVYRTGAGEILGMKNRDRIMKIWEDQERKDRQQNKEGT